MQVQPMKHWQRIRKSGREQPNTSLNNYSAQSAFGKTCFHVKLVSADMKRILQTYFKSLKTKIYWSAPQQPPDF